MKVSENQKGVIFCSYRGKWKEELEKRLQTVSSYMMRAGRFTKRTGALLTEEK